MSRPFGTPDATPAGPLPLLVHFEEWPSANLVRMHQTYAGATHRPTMATATRPTYHPTGPDNRPDAETDIYDDSHDDPETDYHQDQ